MYLFPFVLKDTFTSFFVEQVSDMSQYFFFLFNDCLLMMITSIQTLDIPLRNNDWRISSDGQWPSLECEGMEK